MIGLEKYEMCQNLKGTDVTEFGESGYVHVTAEQKGNCTFVKYPEFIKARFGRKTAPDDPLRATEEGEHHEDADCPRMRAVRCRRAEPASRAGKFRAFARR